MNDKHFETSTLNFASYLYSRNVRFNGLRWNDNQAVFLFETPPDDVLADWLREPGKLIKRYEDAKNFLRDTLEGKR